MNSVSLAIVGFGRIGRIHADNILANDNMTLKMVVDPFLGLEEALVKREVGQSKNIDDLLAHQNIDGVIICSPSNYHVDQIKQISKKTKTIFCEKPLGLSINEIAEVQSLVNNNELNLHVGFNRRFDPDFSSLKSMISNGEIGDIHTIKIISRDPAPPPISYIKKSGGIFLDMTIHDFDMANYLSGSEINEVYAKGDCFINPDIKKADDIDTAIINMRLKSGVLVMTHNSRKAVYGYDQRIEVLGSKGNLRVGNNLLNGIQRGTKNGFTSANPKNFFIDRYEMSYKKEMANFISSVKGEIVDHANVNDALHALKAGLSSKKSLINKKPIMV